MTRSGNDASTIPAPFVSPFVVGGWTPPEKVLSLRFCSRVHRYTPRTRDARGALRARGVSPFGYMSSMMSLDLTPISTVPDAAADATEAPSPLNVIVASPEL